ncbi:ATP-grasp domain-containing protein [Paludisphaera mucosa]|uniref:RimK family alpha-L-glutamate ligase n=1 Tax=Paludisphaera mucosa TaxID=3030827 RepID=A0ABT6FFP4_9BACT|nr:RimK family alpha-L-glutamate ligase [Paludisphaera mucosa]MDG3006397.1 RimK family alpha-L-glutamate ligase [Paludisphaera mucosa]
MPNFAALVSGTGWHVADLLRAAAAVDVSLHVLAFGDVEASVGIGPGRVSACDVGLDGVDGVLVRMMPPGSLEQVVFRMDALHRLTAVGVPVWNPPRSVEAAVDKYLTLSLLERRGLPVPATWTGQTATSALEAFDALGGDVVVKPLFGSEGRGLMRVGHRELAWRCFHALERTGSVIYLQRWIRHPGHDLRLFVLGGRVLGAIRRTARDGEWRTNVAIGGRAEAWTPDAEAARLAVAATEAVGAVFAGVDLIEDLDAGTRVLIEVNAVPGWRALSAATGVDVAAALLDALREAAR